MSVVLSEHLPLLASAPGGIQTLRGLILELAVRGKLVPQDPNDEPASELLKRIAKERARLEAKGIFKKSKATQVSDAERPFDSPEGWVWVRLTHFGEFRGGKTPSTNHSEYWGGSIPWVSPKDMKSLLVSQTEDYVTDLAISDGLTVIPESSVLIVVRSGILRRTVPVAISGLQCTVNQDLKALCLVRPNMAPYVQLLIRGFERLILETLTKVGTTVESIKFEEFSKQPFPLPPLAEQHRIVAKVDELMALCDRLEAKVGAGETAHAKLVDTLLGTLTQSTDAADLATNWQRLAEHFDALFTTEPSLDALKQTILQLAVMGKLVPQDPNDEPASELLKRIAKERARLEADGKIKKSKPVPPVTENESPFKVSRGWEWVLLDAVAEKITDGEHISPSKAKSGMLLLTAKHVLESGVSFDDPQFVAKEDGVRFRQRCDPSIGDVLICSRGTIGRCCVVTNAITFCLMGSVILVRSLPLLVPSYLNFFLKSNVGQNFIRGATKGMAVNALYLKDIRQCAVPLPPLAEQHRIVAKVDELMALCDRLKSDLTESRTRQDRLATTLIDSALKAA